MEETLVLVLLAVVMLVGSYLAGSIPLNVNMSEVRNFLFANFSIMSVVALVSFPNASRFGCSAKLTLKKVPFC